MSASSCAEVLIVGDDRSRGKRQGFLSVSDVGRVRGTHNPYITHIIPAVSIFFSIIPV